MGFIRESFGNITIEQRRESFIVYDDDGEMEFANEDMADLMAALLDLSNSAVTDHATSAPESDQ